MSENKNSNLPVLISGCYRSGTTLLRRLINAHSAFFCGSEIKFFCDFYSNYLKDDIRHLRFFSNLRNLGLEEKQLLDIYGKSYIQCLELASQKYGKKRWCDKNPDHILYLKEWDNLLDQNYHFIMVVRHPLDTLASIQEANFVKTIPDNFQDQVQLYRQYTETGLDFVHQFPNRCSLIRYENLVQHPKETLEALYSDLHEDYEEKILNEFHTDPLPQGLEDLKSRGNTNIYLSSINRWKMDLDKDQIQFAKRKLIDLSNRLGYLIE